MQYHMRGGDSDPNGADLSTHNFIGHEVQAMLAQSMQTWASVKLNLDQFRRDAKLAQPRADGAKLFKKRI